ncbi:peptidase domain-containing ABC transporter [Paenibacillus tuaregi]|uniref:peptidase domain-containing ABC transporter n=1 Tax=Paenibacillus tuaregi TaxID=1816681 RepID=UPI0009EE89AD|nr:peptidase domain-containing ABC transporter [Paenibacillus tuaregi]
MRIPRRRHVPYISQMVQTECGLCCCAMILNYYKSHETLLDLREFIEVGRDGLSMKQLQSLFTGRGFESKMYKANVEQLKKFQLPVIVHWNHEHFLVVEKFTKDGVLIVDPASGSRKIPDAEFEEKFTNYVLTAVPTEDYVPRKRTRRSPWLHVLKMLLEKKRLMFAALLISVVSYLIMLQIPRFVEMIIDKAASATDVQWLNAYLLGIGAITLLYLFVLLARGMSYIVLNVAVSRELVSKTFLHLLKLPFKFFDVRTSGDLIYRLGSINGLRELLTTQLIGGFVDLGAMVFILYYMLSKSAVLTLAAVGICALNVLFMALTRKSIADSINNEIVMQTKSQSIQVESLFAISSIKMSGMEDQVYANWDGSFEQVLDKYKKRSVIQNMYNSVNGTFQTIGPILILVAGMYLTFNKQLSIGEVVAFQALSLTFFGLSTSLFGVYTQYLLATTYLERANDIWEQQPERVPDNPVQHELKGSVELRQVSFSYTAHSERVLKDIDLHIEAGQKVAIVGSSGSGKSTLGKVLVGLYSPVSGEVLYDGIPMGALDRKELCRQMGIVPQDITLFNKTIYENIAMNKEVTMEEIIEAAQIAQIHEEIMAMPMGYRTVISEMGMNLSGGQRQRVALAKALLNHPKLIILDEATSSLDVINESRISDYLKSAGCTRIVIAHRLSTIKDSDLIVVMKNGEIAERGTHAELMILGGVYSELYRTQAGTENEALMLT